MTIHEAENVKQYECFECDSEWTMVAEEEEDRNGHSGMEVEFCPFCGASLNEPGIVEDDLDFGEDNYD